MKFKIGDRVRIIGTGLKRFNLYWKYLWSGVIVGIRANTGDPHVFAVRLNDVKSDGSFCKGMHYFSEDELQRIVTYEDAYRKYIDTDIASTYAAYKLYREPSWKQLTIINVIFNDPATIVFWTDGTKTVVKAQGDDIFDPEKGLAMAIAKKSMGNKGNYCNELKKWLPKEESPKLPLKSASFEMVFEAVGDIKNNLFKLIDGDYKE